MEKWLKRWISQLILWAIPNEIEEINNRLTDLDKENQEIRHHMLSLLEWRAKMKEDNP